MHAATHYKTGVDPVERLRKLSGVYRRTKFEELYLRLFMTVALCVGAYMLGGGITALLTSHEQMVPMTIVLCAGGGALLTIGVYGFARRINISYRIEAGRLSEISSSGTARWEEDLHDLVSLSTPWTYPYAMLILKMSWANHSRRIELFSSLSKAIFGQE